MRRRVLAFAILWSLGCDPTESSSDGGPTDGAPPADAAAADVPQTPGALTPVRTYGFHELTRLTVSPRNWPVISGDGAVAAYTTTTGTPPKITISIVRTDGTGQMDLDSYTPLCGCDGKVDLSFDGKSVVSTDAVQIRFAEMGIGARSVLVLNSPEIWDVRLSDDANRVFFLLRRDAADMATGLPLERGLYVVNSTGTGLKQIVGPGAVAALSSMTLDKAFPFAGCGRSLDVSKDGSKVVFAAAVAGMESVYAANTDGTGLHKLVEASGGFKLMNKIALSGDGKMAAYHAFVGDNMIELGVINFDGTGRRKLGLEPPDRLGGCQGSLHLTADARKLYVSEPGFLYQTDGSGVLQLSSPVFRPPGGMAVQEGTPQGWMNQSGTRFVFHVVDDLNIAQVMFLELDPVSLGDAPRLGAPTFTPQTLAIADLGTARATITVSGPGVVGVGEMMFANGLPDVIDRGGGMIFNDKGMAGDTTAGDGVYTGVGFGAFNPPKPGPRTIRFTAEARSGDRRHATVLEAGTINVQ